jgi:fructose-1,6-bisphosphatase
MYFEAKEVNIVTNSYAEIEIFLDGIPLNEKNTGKDISLNGKLIVSDPGMYNIIDSENSISGILEMDIQGKGFQAFTFTFG